jgi:hypothetical protein
MTDPVTFTATGSLPIAAVALLCLQGPWDDLLTRQRIAGAMASPATRVGHQMTWSARGVTVTVKTVTTKQSLYEATAVIDPEDVVPVVRKASSKTTVKAA